jgi:N-acetylglucosaminyl-diphospho-decaprenol L-rhamnosyltransferase
LTPPADEQQKTTPRVSVVVVSHNRVDWLRRCLASIENAAGRDRYQVIVVENGSHDGSAQLDLDFPNAQWIRLPKNFGLTKAWNLGWRAADAEYVLFLHCDTEVEPGAIARLADILDANTDAVAVCPLLVGEDGRPAPQLGSFPPDAQWRPAEPAGDAPFAVDYPRGAALLVRVFYIKAIRQIDEHYGQFGADAELAAQIKRANRKILLVPDARVRHEGRAGEYTSEETADVQNARAVFLGKYRGFGAGLQARIGSIFGALFGFRLGELKNLLASHKIDGT